MRTRGGLLGIQTAIEMIDSDKNAIKALFYFTDNPAHNGGPADDPAPGTTRDCSLGATVQAFQSRNVAALGVINFFYSVASSGGASCGGYAQASDQMAALVAAVSFPNSNNDLGSFPVTQATLDSLDAALIQLPGPSQLVCLMQKVAFYAGSKQVGSWTGSSLSEEYQSYLDNSPIDATLPASSGATSMSVTSCCVSSQAAAAGDFSNCVPQPPVQMPVK